MSFILPDQFVLAAQLIYTHVEADQSPGKRRGYQTLFYTHASLNTAEVQEIEERLVYPEKAHQQTKHTFFQTRSGKFTLAQCVPLPDSDKFGRGGRYFAHALVFSPETFAQFGNNPFTVFRHFPFWKTVEEARASGEVATGNMPPAQVSLTFAAQTSSLQETAQPVTDNEGKAAPQWEHSQLRTLLLLAAQARRLVAEHRALGLLGPADMAYKLLQQLFELLPPPLRALCSFDTLFEPRVSLSRLPYWAVGLPSDEPCKPNLIPFDLSQQQFVLNVDCVPASAFERWLDYALEQFGLPHVARHAVSAYDLGEWFDGRLPSAPALVKIDDELFRTFTVSNRSALANRVRERLAQQLGDALGKRLFDQAWNWLQQQGSVALQHLDQGFTASPLAEWMFSVYTDSTQRPSPRELQALEQFLRRHKHEELRLIYLRWARQWRELAAALWRLSEEKFRRFANWALQTVSLQVEWRIQQDVQGMLIGPFVVYPEQAEAGEETCHLLLALLGVPEESLAPLPAAVRPKRRSWWRAFKIWPSRQQKGALPAASTAKLPTNNNARRWLWLMDLLSERSRAGGSDEGRL